MAHELHINLRGKASMAYVEEEPWHGLGQKLTRGAPLEVWAAEAGMNYSVQDALVHFRVNDQSPSTVFPARKALFRSDTGAPLAIVGSGYKVVQPLEVLEFFRDLVASGGFELETAGVLYGGAKYWALARTGEEARIGGRHSNDVLREYLLLATACDGTMQTTAQDTSVRVVCNNTLSCAVGQGRASAVKVSHRSRFDDAKVKEELGLNQWKAFVDAANELAKIKVSVEQATKFVSELVADPRHVEEKSIMASRPVQTVLQLFQGQARGSSMKSSAGTAWGLVNSVTEYVDHLAGKGQDARLASAWFHSGADMKTRAFAEALKLA